MTLTGEAKEQFEHYLAGVFKRGYSSWSRHTDFYSLPEAMQWGMYQDFADSVGIDMNTDASLEQDSYWYLFYMKDQKFNNLDDICFKTRQEAREAAIKKLDEILNK
jgi:hypothetical protein